MQLTSVEVLNTSPKHISHITDFFNSHHYTVIALPELHQDLREASRIILGNK